VTSVTDAESLFAQYHDRLLRYLSRAAGEREAARDLTQEVFLRVSRAAIPTGPENQLAGWLFKIARNVALDHHRKRRRRPETDLGSAPEGTKDAQQEMALALKQALATLADLDRDVFLLREVSGLSREEIAIACELTPDAVRSRIHRARLELRAVLAAYIKALRQKHIRR
jgi:RNA polymerase sigma-70 factor (ECF subfamily)